MKVNCILKACIFGVLILIASMAEAQENAYIEVGATRTQFDYTEFDEQGERLLNEHGYVPGLRLAAGQIVGKYEARIVVESSAGEVLYDGQIQAGSPLLTETDEKFTNIAVEVKQRFGAINGVTPVALVGIGNRKWRRDINSTATTARLYEIYRWSYWMLGAATEWHTGPQSVFGIEGRWLRQINPTIDIYVNGFDELSLDLTSKNNYRLACFFNYRYSQKLSWSVELFWQTWHIGRSNTKPLTSGGALTGFEGTEPNSETFQTGIGISARFR